MVKLFDIKETAVFAWSHDPSPLIAAGTLAGVMDDTFSSDSTLTIYNPFSKTASTPVFKADATAKFNSLAWSAPNDTYSNGLLAGALENSTIELWDASKLTSATSSLKAASIATYDKHSTPVLNVTFNPLQSHILGSSASKGEILVWDTNKGTSFSPGQAISPMSKVSCFEWNNSMSHIFGTAGDSGYASIWDLKAKREVLQLTYNGLNMSVLQWHPNQSTKLVTATDSDGEPIILTWDLRNSSVPEKIMKGHKKGILSLDWCKQDPTLLLSSGKDDSTKLWNPVEGIELASYPSLPNWVQQTKFAPKLPEVFASASLSKSVIIQSLQDTSAPVSVKVQSENDDDFWNQISTTETQKATFHHAQAPSWLKRPVNATFGFGGKLVVTKNNEIRIVSVSKNGEMEKAAKELITALSSNDYKSICDSKVTAEVKLEEGKDWKLLADLLSNGKAETLKSLLPDEESKEVSSNEKSEVASNSDEDDFFAQLGSAKQVENKAKYVPTGTFKLFGNSSDSKFENEAIELILNHKTEAALDLCIENDKLMEALIISMNGSEDMKAKARGAYFAKFATESPFSRLLYSASTNDVSDVVKNAEIDSSSWKNVVKSIVSFSKGTPKFVDEMKTLGDRLIEAKLPNARDDAFKCYVAADALDKIASIWLDELDDYEKFFLETENADGSKNTSFEARFKAIGEVVEKTVVFESVSKSVSSVGLEPLGKIFQEYANYLANDGHFELAYKILEKANDSIPGIKEEKNRLSKSFLKTTSVKASLRSAQDYKLKHNYATPTPTVKPSISSLTASATNGLPPNPYAQPQSAAPNVYSAPPVTAAPNPYSVPAVNSAAPLPVISNQTAALPRTSISGRSINRYAPKTAIDSLQNPVLEQQPSFAMPPPPPPQKKKDVGGWNDLPVNLSKTPKVSTQNLPTAYSAAIASTSMNPSPSGSANPNAVPPPPTGHSRSPSTNMKSPTPPIKNGSRVSSRNPYEPKPEVVEPVRVASNVASPMIQPVTFPPTPQNPSKLKNPYAPKEIPASSAINTPPPINNGFAQTAPPNAVGLQPPQFNQTYAPPLPAHSNGIAPPAQSNLYSSQVQTNENGNPYALSGKIQTGPPTQQFNPYAPTSRKGSVAPPSRNGSIVPPPPPQTIAAASSPAQPSTLSLPSVIPQQQAQPSISAELQNIEDILSGELTAVKPKIPERFQKHAQDAEKRLNILFGSFRKGEIEDEVVSILIELTNALKDGDFENAKSKLAQVNESQGGKWLPGIKRLIGMVEVTKS